MVRYMNDVRHYLLAVFLVTFLSSCGTNLKKSNEKADDIAETSPSESELYLVEELNKLDKRLSQRLDDLEVLIKSNRSSVKKRPVKKPAKSASNRATASKSKSLKSSQNNKVIIGEVEWVYLHTLNQSLKSRVDSGATTSSITASNIQPFERDGKNWVKFDVMHRATDTKATIETPVVRIARIRQASSDSYERRFIVSLDISLGDSLKQKAEFSLANRSEMKFPILLGREFLQDITLIDVGKKFLHPKFKPEDK